MQKITLQLHQNNDEKKDPSNFLKRKLQTYKKMMGVLIKMKIPKSPLKLQVTQPYPTSRIRIEVKGDK